MVERCNAINARDADRLKRVYTKDASEPEWLAKEWFPNYERWGIKMEVAEVKKISIVGIDASGSFQLKVSGRKFATANVDVLYVKEGTEWKIESVAER